MTIQIATKLGESEKLLGMVCIKQIVINGPGHMEGRTVNLRLEEQEAIDLAIRILKELVPGSTLRVGCTKQHLATLSEFANRVL